MNKTIDEMINKGVPIDIPLFLSFEELSSICEDQKQFEEVTKLLTKSLNEIISSLDLNFYIYYTLIMEILADPKTLERKIYIVPESIYQTLLTTLFPKSKVNELNKKYNSSNEEVFDLLRKRIDKLRKLKKKNNLSKEQVLQMDYPYLYKVYIENKKSLEYIYSINTKYTSGKISYEEYGVLLDRFLKENYSRLDSISAFLLPCLENNIKKEYTITSFCNDYADFLEKFLEKFYLLEEKFFENPVDFKDIKVDEEKFELYLAFSHIDLIKKCSYEYKQNFIYFLANYFKEKPYRKNSNTPCINIGAFEREVTPAIVYEEYKKILINNPYLKPVTFSDVDFSGMSKSDLEIFISEYLETFKANWDVIPLEEVNNHGYRHNPREKVDDLDRRIELFMEKKEFYGDLDPFMCVRGKKTFDGYIGYIFTNGMVVLDKFYQNSKKGIVSKGDAIYCMKVEDFY